MEDKTAQALVRQLKILNFWITLFGVSILIALVILGVLLYKIVTYVNDTRKHLVELQQKTSQTLDVKQQLCDSKTGAALLKGTDACK
jgi:CHASE3 domain sensor protein